MTIGRNQGLGKRDNRLKIKQFQIRWTRFEHAMGKPNLFVDTVQAIRVVLQCPIQVSTHLRAPLWGQDILQKEIAISMESLHPFLNLFRAGNLSGKIGWSRSGGCHGTLLLAATN